MGFFRKIKARFTKPKASMSLILGKPKYTLGEDIDEIYVDRRFNYMCSRRK